LIASRLKLEIRNWKPEIGNWKPELENSKTHGRMSIFEFPVSNFQFRF